MKKFLIILFIVLVLGALVRIFVFNKAKTKEKITTTIAVEVLPVKRADVFKTCQIIGAIMADKTAQVFPETMGRVIKILVRDGTTVQKGDKLMVIKNETVGFEFEEAYVTSPISGAVARVLVDVGSMVTPQAPVAMVVDFARVKVAFNAPEIDASYFSRNKQVLVTADALPGKEFSGFISEISPVIDPMTRTVSIKANIDNQKRLLKPGMTARVSTNLGERKNVIALPDDAIIDHNVFVVKADSTVEKRSISIGLVGDYEVEIQKGLSENEMVVVVGQQRLSGGEKVHPVTR